ncbi:MAG: phage tail protein [Dyadobacter sp.]|uniref:phage tail protein n=1 Tax=Dyadobacter sp. TaxID=1914288 RepID=UPI001B2CF257|nr:tail fiber protein [Dyadobacter sp.]MBO9611680.1 phage tail protein [Dyadobacter sp.]
MDYYVGEIRPFAGGRIPEGWRLCDGAELLVAEQQALYSLIQFTYGGNGLDKFCVPDLRSRIPLGEGGNYAVGVQGGEEKVSLTTANLPRHRHLVGCSTSNVANLPTAVDGLWCAISERAAQYNTQPGKVAMHTESVGMEGSGEGHENRIPVLAVNYIIALGGIFPPHP